MRSLFLAGAWAGAFLCACGTTAHGIDDGGPGTLDGGPPAEIPRGVEASLTVGAAGGTLVLRDLALVVPPGALAEDTVLRVIATDSPVPGSFTGFSPVYRFEPAGLAFAAPVEVRLPFDGRLETATIFWTAAGGDAYVARPTRVEGRVAITETTHFSSAFVGTACAGEDCCGRANGELDVLLVVDSSNSMSEEQAMLHQEIPRLARVLATGDLDDDGVQDFPALARVRIGTVTTDIGTGGYTVPTCSRSDLGDDAVLRTEGRVDLAGCLASYPPFAELSVDGGDPAVFAQQVGCTAVVGTGGCGFEQQLEALLKATTPSTSDVRFVGGTLGQADRANAGFLRPDSVLAAIVLTDENDCSASDPALFDPGDETYGATDLNLRCMMHADAALHPVSRYADGLRALRPDPRDLVFALIAGVPPDLVADPASTDLEAVLADPRMQEVVDPSNPSRVLPSCDSAGRGLAFPPRRLVETARDLGSSAVVQSICQDDFTPVLDAILQRVAARVSGSCG